MENIRVVDLFAGIGGLRNGVVTALTRLNKNPKVVFTSEIKKAAIQTLQANHPNEVIHGDITKINENSIPYHDILLAGFPCQAFSYAGKRQGFADATKGTLFFDVARILAYHKPKYFILENVEGLIMHNRTKEQQANNEHGQTLNTILETLTGLGYSVDYWLLNAADYGIPQARKRIFIVGEYAANRTFAAPVKKTPAVLETILDTNVKETNADVIKMSQKLLETYTLEDVKGKFIRDKRSGSNNLHSWNFNWRGETTENERQLLEDLALQSRRISWAKKKNLKHTDGIPLSVKEIASFVPFSESDILTMLTKLAGQGYVKKEENGEFRILSGKLSFPLAHILNPDKPAPTLVATDANRLGVIDNGQIRRLTLSEKKKLFGFDESFVFPDSLTSAQVFDLFGNSVVSSVAEEVCYSVMSSKNKKEV